jgi:exosortase family protein XrtF
LNQFDENQVDGITQFVAQQTKQLLSFFNYPVYLLPHESQASVKFFLNDIYTVRIVEGCNAMSVIILFVAFVIAFSGKIKATILYVLSGILMIHIMNIIRIAMLTILLQKYPEYQHLLHGVVFPLVIYGFVFLLWVIWVNKFSFYATNNSQK